MSDCAKKTFHDKITEHSPHSACLTAVTPAEDSEEERLDQAWGEDGNYPG